MTYEHNYSSGSRDRLSGLNDSKAGIAASFLFCVFYIISFSQAVFGQLAYPLTPISGADGVFEVVIIDGDTLYRAGGSNGSYELYMYFKTDVEVRDTTAYIEVTYKDIGFGILGLQYNSNRSNYRDTSVRYQNYVQNSRSNRIAVFELKNANFRDAQNLGTDLRLYQEGNLQMHILSANVYLEPPATFLKYKEDWISPRAIIW